MTDSVNLSQFDTLANHFLALQSNCSPSFYHGWLVGSLAAGQRLSDEDFVKESHTIIDPQKAIPDTLKSQIEDLYQSMKAQFEDTHMPLQPLLPDEQDGLDVRVMALGQWCEGMLAGIGGSGQLTNSDVNSEVREMLEDLMAISQVEMDADDGDSAHYFEQVKEHAKVIAYGLYFEFNGQLGNQATENGSDKPTLH